MTGFLIATLACVATADFEPIDVRGFRSSASHWRRLRNANRMIQPLSDQPAYKAEQVAEIAENILLYQRDDGGWPKDYDMAAVLTPEQREGVLQGKERFVSSFDNDNIHTQVNYLARAFAQGGPDSWREACLRGLDFILEAQLPGGGWPQSHPNPKGYAAHITFNDGVMIGILDLLLDIDQEAPHWAWLDRDRRKRVREAIPRGIDCILACQIVVSGQRTGWCQQHDATTHEAAPARTFELASICPQDTTQILRFLMRLDDPSPEIREAIETAAAWMASVPLAGVRVEKVAALSVQYDWHKADFDLVVVEDPEAPPLWARHYEIGTNRPVFAGRDAIVRYSLADVERERRTGTAWFGYWPASLLDKDLPRWRAHHGIQPAP